MGAAVDPQNRTGRSDAFRQEMQHAARTAADIDDFLARPDADLFELRVGIWGEVGDLPLETLLLRQSTPKQVDVRLGQRLLPPRP